MTTPPSEKRCCNRCENAINSAGCNCDCHQPAQPLHISSEALYECSINTRRLLSSQKEEFRKIVEGEKIICFREECMQIGKKLPYCEHEKSINPIIDEVLRRMDTEI